VEHQSFRGASAASENSRQATFSGSYSIVFTPKVGLCIYKFKLWSSSVQYSSIIKRRFSSQGMFHWNRLERDRGLPKGVTSSVGPGLLL